MQKKLTWWGLAGAVWLGAVAFGLHLMMTFATVQGEAGKGPVSWPREVAASSLQRAASGYTLVMAVHPKCACTRASLHELERLMAQQPMLHARILVLAPEAEGERWTHTDLWKLASRIPGAQMTFDREGTMAARFGLLTSGQTVLYDAAGRLRYSGGLTEGRGEDGDSEGSVAIAKIVEGGKPKLDRYPVYGCALGNNGKQLANSN